MKKYGNEFKVGLMVISTLIILGYFTVRASDFTFKRKGYQFMVAFEDIMGLGKNAPVRLRGFEVGSVDDIAVNYSAEGTKILLTLWVDEKFKIRHTPTVSIKTLGMMGEKYIQIVDGDTKGAYVQEGEIIPGANPADFEAIMSDAQKVITNTNDLVLEMKDLASNINTTLQHNEKGLDSIITNLEKTSKNFEAFSADLKDHPWKLFIKGKRKRK